MPYGYCENTSYIRHGSTREITDRIAALFEQEGMQRIDRPAVTLDHVRALNTNLWGIAVFPGVAGWNVIKTTPDDLLSDRAAGASCSRLAELCAALEKPGFQVSVGDGPPAWGEVVLEIDGRGAERASGWWFHEDFGADQDSYGFYDVKLNPESKDVYFAWLPEVQTLLQESRDPALCTCQGDSDFEKFCAYLAERLGGDNGSASVYRALDRGPPLPCVGGIMMHFEWPAGDRPYPRPSDRERAERLLFAQPRFFYADGSPVRLGDAVLVGDVCSPGHVAAFRAVGVGQDRSPRAMPTSEYYAQRDLQPAAVVVEHGADETWDILFEHVGARLKLVERETCDYVQAGMNWISEHARQENVTAQFALGSHYLSGRHVPKEFAQAAEWLRRAAGQGHRIAQYKLGHLCFSGKGVAASVEEALAWWRQSAAAGYAAAQYTLGLRYNKGEGVPKDYALAVAWYQKAAEQGFPQAQCNLADKYEHGRGVPQDYAQALHWYGLAARQGIPEAEFSLGMMYREGHGVAADPQQAAKWWHRAGMNRHPEAQFQLARLYELGEGVKKELNFAKAWYESAAKEGHLEAQERLKHFKP